MTMLAFHELIVSSCVLVFLTCKAASYSVDAYLRKDAIRVGSRVEPGSD